jgi:hypothetical protein
MGNTASMRPDEGNANLKRLVEDFLAGAGNDLRMSGGPDPVWAVPQASPPGTIPCGTAARRSSDNST